MQQNIKKLLTRYDLGRENIGMIVLVIAGLWIAWNTLFIVLKNNRLQNDIARLEQEVAVLQLENQNLELSIQYYTTDDFVEQSLRDDLLLKREGENVAIAPQTKDAFYAPPAADQEREVKKSNFQQWIDFLSGN